MKKNRLIFYAVLAIFHLCAFIFTVALPSIMFSIIQYVPYFKYITFLGLILLIIDFAWSWRVNIETKKEKSLLEHELTTLKAKVFDLQEAAKK